MRCGAGLPPSPQGIGARDGTPDREGVTVTGRAQGYDAVELSEVKPIEVVRGRRLTKGSIGLLREAMEMRRP